LDFQAIPNYWRVRIRIVVLVTILTAGFGLAAVERWRPDKTLNLWDRANSVLAHLLNPIRDLTRRTAEGIFKIDQLWSAEEENKRLKRDLSKQRLENQLLSEELGRLNRLSGLGHWSGPPELNFLTADVIGLLANEQSAALIINRGRADGVRPRDPVVALGGLVGVVQSVSAHTARVQAITDPLSAVGAVDHGSRARGIVYGRGRNRPLDFTPENEIQPIDKQAVLITSGFENSVFPKGVVIGVIQDRKFNAYGIPYGEVKPAVSFEALEEVLLVIPRRRAAGDERNSTATLGHATIRMPSAPADAIQTTDTLTSGSAATLADGLAAAHTTSTLTLDELEPDTTETSASLNGGDSSAETTPKKDRGGAAAESGDATE
jgi:rod shape-determining protein MreC